MSEYAIKIKEFIEYSHDFKNIPIKNPIEGSKIYLMEIK